MADSSSGFELFETVDAFILKGRQSCLWCNRLDGRLIVRSLSEFKNAWEPVSLGIVYGCIGKIRLVSDGEWRLLLIGNRTSVGKTISGHDMFRIDKAVSISMAPDDASELELEVSDPVQTVNQKSRLKLQNNPRQKAFLQTLSTYRAAQTQKPKKEVKDVEKLEKRLLEELLKMFSSDSFFFCPGDDLGNTVQRMGGPSYNADLPIWKRFDDRFFWNKHMLTDLLKSDNVDGQDEWILPIIQGHVEVHQCSITEGDQPLGSPLTLEGNTSARQNAMSTLSRFARRSVFREQSHGDSTSSQHTDDQRRNHGAAGPRLQGSSIQELDDSSFKLYVISRRSRHRAGTRFLRRGADETGAVANYVETEQIVVVRTHTVSFVQVRGSIPVFWSQLGLKYRPPPKIDRSEEESQKVFKLHFDEQLELHGKVAVINLVEQQGREKIMADAYVKHMDLYNNDESMYITFDFHEHCKGMHFENVENLVDALDPIIRSHRYCWRDREGVLCEQLGVMRINCMDCLDRTNVVMAAMARRVLLTLLFKLGLLSPDSLLPSATRATFQMMWANNGDAVSRQYAGTAALKGDFTRTGERSMMGVMKDGYNSASRYYVNHFRDVYRQTVIDLMHGNAINEDLLRLARNETVDLGSHSPDADEWTMEREESVAYSITKCRQLLVTDEEGTQGWAVVEHGACSGLMDTHEDIDLVLLLVPDALFVAIYDYDFDDVSQYDKIPLDELHSFQIGVLSSTVKGSSTVFLRLLRRQNGDSGFFYTFKPVHSHSSSEAKENLQSIVQCLQKARTRCGLPALPYHETKLSRNRSKRPGGMVVLSQSQMKQSWSWKPRRNDNGNPAASSTAAAAGAPGGGSGRPERLTKASRLLNVSFNSLRKHDLPGGTDSEDNLDEGASPRVRLKAEGRRMMLQVKRFIRNESNPGSDSDETSPSGSCGAIVTPQLPPSTAVGGEVAMLVECDADAVAPPVANGSVEEPDTSPFPLRRGRSSQIGEEEIALAKELMRRLSPPLADVDDT